MAKKPHITIEPPGAELHSGTLVTFHLKAAPEGDITWRIEPHSAGFESDAVKATWTPDPSAAGSSYTIRAEVRDHDKVAASANVGVFVCAPGISSNFEEVTEDTREVTFTLGNVPKNADYQWQAIPEDVGSWQDEVGRINKKTDSRIAVLCIAPSVLGKLPGAFTVRAYRTVPAYKVEGPGTGKAESKGEARAERQLVAEFSQRIRGMDSRPSANVGVAMQRTQRPPTPDQILWVLIRNSARAISFGNYETFINIVFCGDILALCDFSRERSQFLAEAREQAKDSSLRLPFPGVDPYRLLKAATEVFVTSRCGVLRFDPPPRPSEERRRGVDLKNYKAAYDDYLDSDDDPRRILPYLALVLARLGDVRLVKKVVDAAGDEYEVCQGILEERLAYPCLIELIWSYWHEEGMLAQAMNALSHRFQNLRASGPIDPLAQLEIDPLRPLNNLIWGYVQDEQHRLSVLRRAHEYDHHYGMPLVGRAVSDARTIDVRSKFLESFHNLLYQAIQFFRQDDDTTVIADGFPVLNALKETHYLLAQGAHNQFGDLPATSRQEMLIEQWLLSRPEMREFLGGRVMVPYPEPWMDKVDAVKTLKGWTDTSVVHFHDLAVFGEQILLSVRYGGWSVVNDPEFAANWARYWRPEVQGYIHGYRAATGVDLTADITDQQQLTARFMAPSVHLRNRLAIQAQGRQPAQITAGRISAQFVARRTATDVIPASRRLTRGNP